VREEETSLIKEGIVVCRGYRWGVSYDRGGWGLRHRLKMRERQEESSQENWDSFMACD